jgi:hypothetical protein
MGPDIDPGVFGRIARPPDGYNTILPNELRQLIEGGELADNTKTLQNGFWPFQTELPAGGFALYNHPAIDYL